jgi:hypothetical protein
VGDIIEAKQSVEVLARRPLRFGKIAVGATVAGTEYPLDNHLTLGLPLQTGASSTQVYLNPTDIGFTMPTGDPPLLIVITNDTGSGAKWQYRQITAFTASGLFPATISPAWTVQPLFNDSYLILVDLTRCNDMHIKTEYSSTTNNATLLSAFWDFPMDPTNPNKLLRAPYRFMDTQVTADQLALTNDPTHSAYSHGRSRSVTTRGAMGAKIQVNTLDTGSIDIWAGGN